MVKFKPKLLPYLIKSNFNFIFFIGLISIVISILISFTYNYLFIIILIFINLVLFSYKIIESIISYKKTELIFDQEKKEITYKTGNLITNQETKTKISNIVFFSEYKNIFLFYLFNVLDIEISLSNSRIRNIKVDCLEAKDISFLTENFLDKNKIINYQIYKPSIKSLLLISLIEFKNILIYFLVSIFIFIFLYQFIQVNFLFFNTLIIFLIFINLGLILFKIINAFIQIFKTKLIVFSVSIDDLNEEQIYLYEKYQTNLIEIKKTFFKSFNITDIFYNQDFKEKIIGIKKIYISFINTPDSIIIENFDSSFTLKKTSNEINIESQLQEKYQELRPNKIRFFINLIFKSNLALIITILGFLISSFFLTIVPVFSFLFLSLKEFIEMMTTKYYYSDNKIISINNFLILKENIAKKSNITSIRISQDIIDKLMNTVSLQFYTKGSSGAIKFLHVDLNKHSILALNNIIPQEYIMKLFIKTQENKEEVNCEISYKGQKHLINHIIYEFINIPGFLTIIPSIALYSLLIEENSFLFTTLTFLALIYYFFIYMNNYLDNHKSKLDIYKDLIIHDYGFFTKITKIIKKEYINEIKIDTYPFQGLKKIEIIPEGKSMQTESEDINKFFPEIDHENNISFMFFNPKTNNIKKIYKYMFYSASQYQQIYNTKRKLIKPNIKTTFIRLTNPLNIILNLNLLFIIIKIKTIKYIFTKKYLIEKSKFVVRTTRIIPYNKISNIEKYQDYINKYTNTQTIIIFPHASNHNIILLDLKDSDSEYTYNLFQNMIQKKANESY